MDTLLAQQELYLRPVGGRFDVEAVAQAVAAIPFAWRDEQLPSLFLMFLDEASRNERVARRRADPEAALPYVLLVQLEPDQIMLNQFAGPAHRDQSRALLGWLAARYNCDVRNEADLDLSAHWPRML